MKILVVSQYYYPEQFRINDICEELVNRGHSITVLTGMPNYPEGSIYQGYEKNFYEIHNGVRIIRCNIRPRKKGTLNLLLNYISFAYLSCRKVKTVDSDYDEVFVYQLSPVFMALPGLVYKRNNGGALLINCCDIWPESIKDVCKNEKSIAYRCVKSISSYIYRNADQIIVKSPSFKDYLSSVCSINKNNIQVILEHAEDTYLSINEEPTKNGIIDFMFMGNIGLSQDCEVIVRATKLLDSHLPFMVHFIGDGSDLERIKRLTYELGLNEKIVFHGRHSVDEMPYYYSFADVCLLTLANTNATGLTVPAKLTGYLAASRPVVGAISGDATEIIRNSKCGYYVNGGDFKGLSEIMYKCIVEPDTLPLLGSNGRSYFKSHFTKKIFIDLLENSMIDLRNANKTNI